MKSRDIRELSPEELQHQYDEVKAELFNLRMQRSAGQLENPVRLRLLRKDVARLKTELHDRKRAST